MQARMIPDDVKNMTFIFKKVFDDPGCPNAGTTVFIYYQYSEKKNIILVEDYSIHFTIDGVMGENVADDHDKVDDDLYQFLFKTSYQELVNHVIMRK